MPRELEPTGVGPGFKSRQEMGVTVEVLDETRIHAALVMLHQEQDISDAMAGKPPRERRKRGVSSGSASTISKSVDDCGVVLGQTVPRTPKFPIAGDRGGGGKGMEDSVGGSVGASEDQGRGKRERTRDVLAVYKHRGAQLVLAQTRKRHPFRQEGVFCRADRGEWAGQVYCCVLVLSCYTHYAVDRYAVAHPPCEISPFMRVSSSYSP